VPRGLTGLRPPEPQLADDAVRLEPLRRGLEAELQWIVGDEEIRRFTYVPSAPEPEFLERWLARYEQGWADATRAGFAIRGTADGALLGFAALVRLDLEQREGEIGYMLDRAARGRGAATRAVGLLTRWGFDTLGLKRLELRISAANDASQRVAAKAGYRLEGVLRSVAFKEGLRDDVGVWSRLSSD
jgi:RimJ/RimL family protein N-acetyltransferase